MSLKAFFHRPRSVSLRRALFQVHLFTGLGVGLYLFAIGISGAVLVFRTELQRAVYPQLFRATSPDRSRVSMSTLVEALQKSYPNHQIAVIEAPTTARETFLGWPLRDKKWVAAFSDPTTGEVLGQLPEGSFFAWVQDLHFNLLAGSVGRIVNGTAAACLGVLCATGLMIWWPGVSNWRRRLRVDFRKGWKRSVWELHGAVGVWMAALLFMWAVSGVNYVFPQQFRSILTWFSVLTPPPNVVSNPTLKERQAVPDAQRLVAKAEEMAPGAELVRISFPTNDDGPVVIVMTQPGQRRSVNGGNLSFYFDQFNGRLLHIWDQTPRTAGDFVLSWLAPLHLGTFGGTGSKILWVVFGFSPSLLFVTGAAMWWNRVVGKRWDRLTRATERIWGAERPSDSSVLARNSPAHRGDAT